MDWLASDSPNTEQLRTATATGARMSQSVLMFHVKHRSLVHNSSGQPAPCDNGDMNCRPGCAACCTAPSISSPMPGLPHGKPAGVPCPHLDADLRCGLFGQPERPAVCGSLQPSAEMCGDSREQALRWLTALEMATR